jgi:FSR family fosmidomycin resistance protein-like MFS transporter
VILSLPLLLGLAHGVSDAAAGLLVGLIIQRGSANINFMILQYKLLAFGLQPVVGILLDRINRPRQGAAIGLLLTLTGLAIIPISLPLAILFIGLGSAGLHAGGGSVAISSTPGKASAVGVFAAFGVVGLALGGLASVNAAETARFVLMALLTLLACLAWFTPQANILLPGMAEQFTKRGFLLLVVLVTAIALRSTVWVGAPGNLARYANITLWLALSAGTGKLLGGFGADRFGWQRWMLLTLLGAGLLLIFSSAWLPGMMLGVLLLQSVTPLSVAAVARSLPRFPALAASLTFGTAIIAGGLPFFILPPGWFTSAILAVTLTLSVALYSFALKNEQHSSRS